MEHTIFWNIWSVNNLAKYTKEEVGGDFSNKRLAFSLTELVESFESSKGSEGLPFISAGGVLETGPAAESANNRVLFGRSNLPLCYQGPTPYFQLTLGALPKHHFFVLLQKCSQLFAVTPLNTAISAWRFVSEKNTNHLI